MRRSPKPAEREPSQTIAPSPQSEAPAVKLRIEELEPRLTPQSTAAILE